MSNPESFRPGEILELKGRRFQVAAINYDGKMILRPAYVKESTGDMMMRLQSTAPAKLTEPQDTSMTVNRLIGQD